MDYTVNKLDRHAKCTWCCFQFRFRGPFQDNLFLLSSILNFRISWGTAGVFQFQVEHWSLHVSSVLSGQSHYKLWLKWKLTHNVFIGEEAPSPATKRQLSHCGSNWRQDGWPQLFWNVILLGKGANNPNGNLRGHLPRRGGVSRGSRVLHTYSEKWFFLKTIWNHSLTVKNVFCS